MSQVKRPYRQVEIPTQRGRKLRKTGGRLRPFWVAPRVGPPRCDTRPPVSRQPKGPYQSVPDSVVDSRPPVRQRPLTAAAEKLLELYFRFDAFVMAIEEHTPVEWAGERILGVRKARAYEIQREIAAHGGLDAWFCQKVLEGMSAGRIGRGRETRPSRLADAFFIALAGGQAEARSCAQCLAGNGEADLQEADRDDPDPAASEVRDYLVYSHGLWRVAVKMT